MDAFRRASSLGFIPTTVDHRRFGYKVWDVREDKYTFKSEPTRVSILDCNWRVPMQSRIRRFQREFCEEATGLLSIVDLAQYDRDLDRGVSAVFRTDLTDFIDFANAVTSGRSFSRTQASMMIMFWNAEKLKEKMAKKPFGSVYKDFKDEENLNGVIRYIMDKVLADRKGDLGNVDVYYWVGELTDAATVGWMLGVLKETMWQQTLRQSGLFR